MDDEHDNQDPNLVTISSKDPRAAARAVAILGEVGSFIIFSHFDLAHSPSTA
jgi:hypothetical protein